MQQTVTASCSQFVNKHVIVVHFLFDNFAVCQFKQQNSGIQHSRDVYATHVIQTKQ